jgi:hypothetical protein
MPERRLPTRSGNSIYRCHAPISDSNAKLRCALGEELMFWVRIDSRNGRFILRQNARHSIV